MIFTSHSAQLRTTLILLCITRGARLSVWCQGHYPLQNVRLWWRRNTWGGAVRSGGQSSIHATDWLGRQNKLGTHHCFLALFTVQIPLFGLWTEGLDRWTSITKLDRWDWLTHTGARTDHALKPVALGFSKALLFVCVFNSSDHYSWPVENMINSYSPTFNILPGAEGSKKKSFPT